MTAQKRSRRSTGARAAVDVTALMEWLSLMIQIADKQAENAPYPPGIKKLRDGARRALDEAEAALTPR